MNSHYPFINEAHYNDTLPDLAIKCVTKQSWQVLSRFDIETIMAHFTIFCVESLYWENGLTNINFKKSHSSTKN